MYTTETHKNPIQMNMLKQIRTTVAALAVFFSAAALAQPGGPYTVLVNGTVVGCTANSLVTINTIPGTLPAIADVEIPVGTDCTFNISLTMDTPTGGFTVTTLCGGLSIADTLFYTASAFDSTGVYVALNCGGSNADCEGIVGGSALPGTACDDGNPITFYDTWTPSCECIGGTLVPCQVCFSVDSVVNNNGAVPFTIAATNCSYGGVEPYTYLYDFGDGETSIGEDVVHTYAAAGPYIICLTMADNNGCTTTTCDSVLIGTDGAINPVFFYDCTGILNGPNVNGTPCSIPGTSEPGTWDYTCTCIPDSIYYTCMAGYIAQQAYVNGDSAGTPIPNEVWIWNDSQGNGTPTYTWDFGDGTSSTDAYPTHVYAGNGPYVLCLTMAIGTACTSTYCDSISMDANGILQGMMIDGGHVAQLSGVRTEGFTLNVIQAIPTGIADVPAIADLNVWPNPVSNELNVTFNSIQAGASAISVIGTDGRVLLREEHRTSSGSNTVKLNATALAPGLYLLQISSGAQRISQRFLKVR